MAAYRVRKHETIDLGGLCFVVGHRTLGDDGGAAIEVYGEVEGMPVQVLRFDCFRKSPHYHLAPEGEDARRDLDPLSGDCLEWALEQIKSRMPQMLREAGFARLADSIDARALADGCDRIRGAILATTP